MQERILSKHFRCCLDKLKTYYNHSGIAKHGDVSGLCREGFIKLFLKDNLPGILEYRTGEIFDKFDNRSGQIDIVIYPNFCPKIELYEGISLLFNDYTIGAIEVKSDLNTQHFANAIKSIKKIKDLNRDVKISGQIFGRESEKIIFDETPYFLIAYDGPNINTLLRKMFSIEFKYCPEVITIFNK